MQNNLNYQPLCLEESHVKKDHDVFLLGFMLWEATPPHVSSPLSIPSSLIDTDSPLLKTAMVICFHIEMQSKVAAHMHILLQI